MPQTAVYTVGPKNRGGYWRCASKYWQRRCQGCRIRKILVQIDRLEVEHEVVRAVRYELGGTTLKTLPTVIIGCLEVVPKGGGYKSAPQQPP